MLKSAYILIIITLSIALTPSSVLACGSKKTTTCTSNKSTVKNEQQHCCKSNNHSTKNHKGCDGKCKDKTCPCPTANFSYCILNAIQLVTQHMGYLPIKLNYYYVNAYLTSGFYSIWVPPNISLL